ncbi:MFS family permease [Novosphingobium sp. SG707]|nr:MFS family permease [Novosphingobium sp. SG707]
MTGAPASSTTLEHHARLINARDPRISPRDIAVGVIIGRSTEFFDFFVYAIASVLVFPSLMFPYASPLQGTLYSFAIFSLAFVARPLGALLFIWIDRRHGRGVKLTLAMFLLGGSTAAIAFVPGYDQAGPMAAVILALFRLGQGFAQGGTWDGLPALLSLNAPVRRRGWFAMIPQLGAACGAAGGLRRLCLFALYAQTGGFSRLGLALHLLRRFRHQCGGALCPVAPDLDA